MTPAPPVETVLDNAYLSIIALLMWSYALWFVLRRLRRRRPQLTIERQVALGFLLRVLSIAAVTATGIGQTLRGGDEITFLGHAHTIAAASFTSDVWQPGGQFGLHEILFALQIRLGGFGTGTMRVTQVGLAMLGTILIVAAVHDLGGARAARLAAWLVAIEPASIFFSEILHKESLILLASGIVIFGAAQTWERISASGLATMLAGSLIAVATRPYAGWFLASAAVLLTLHASVRHLGRERARSLPVLLGVAAVIILATPVILQASSPASLQANLQPSQNANAAAAGTPGNNLALEHVDFATRGSILTNLPLRISDLLLKPYPWQVGSTSQQVGVVGTLVALAVIGTLSRLALRLRGRVLASAAPLLYPAAFLTTAYALSVGNAGTGFRYRTELIPIAIATLALLRERVLSDPVASATARPRRPLPRASSYAGRSRSLGVGLRAR